MSTLGEDTPVEMPAIESRGAAVPPRPRLKSIAGEIGLKQEAEVPEPRRVLRSTLQGATAGGGGVDAEAIASAIEQFGDRIIANNGSNNGGKPPPTGLAKVVRSFPMQVVAVIIAGGVSVYATIEATKALSEENEKAVVENVDAIKKTDVVVKELKDGAKKTTEAIERIDETIGGQGGISDTLKTLTDESRQRTASRALLRLEGKVDDLKEENDELRAKVREERRKRRD